MSRSNGTSSSPPQSQPWRPYVLCCLAEAFRLLPRQLYTRADQDRGAITHNQQKFFRGHINIATVPVQTHRRVVQIRQQERIHVLTSHDTQQLVGLFFMANLCGCPVPALCIQNTKMQSPSFTKLLNCRPVSVWVSNSILLRPRCIPCCTTCTKVCPGCPTDDARAVVERGLPEDNFMRVVACLAPTVPATVRRPGRSHTPWSL